MVSCMGIPNLRNSQYKKLHRVESTPSTQIVSYHEILSVFNQSNFNVAKFPKFSPWAPINTVQCTIRTSTDATQESSGFQWRNSPKSCCGTQISEVPALNSEREGNETQHCPHFQAWLAGIGTGSNWIEDSVESLFDLRESSNHRTWFQEEF